MLARPLLAASLFVLIACGGASDHEKLARDMDSLSKDLVEVLAGITDVESAREALAPMEAIGERRAELDARATELGLPAEEDMERLAELSGGAEFEQRMGEELQRLMALPDVWPIVNETLLQSMDE